MADQVLAVRPGGPLRGRIRVPGDKSISHRALLLGAIATGRSHVRGVPPSADCRATLRAVRALGIEVERTSRYGLAVYGRGRRGLQEAAGVLDCARSGTTIRLLAGLLAGQPFLTILSGDVALLQRPMGRVVEPLRLMGSGVWGRDGGRCAPLAILGGSLHGIEYTLPVASAQVKGALLLAGLYAGEPTTLHLPGPARDHTERLLRLMSCPVAVTRGRGLPAEEVAGSGAQAAWTVAEGSEHTGETVRLAPVERLVPVSVDVPGDFSSAAFLMVAAALVPGSEIELDGIGANPDRTGLLDLLRAMGADLHMGPESDGQGEPAADLVVRASGLKGVEARGSTVLRAIDELPVLAVAATQAEGVTTVAGAAELRVKESDRIAGMVQELRRMGAEIEARPDGYLISGPTPLHGAPVDAHGDHRLAMALTVAGLIARGETTVQGAQRIDDSYPGFAAALRRLGAEVT